MICEDEKIIAKSIENLICKVGKASKKYIRTRIAKNGIECLYKIYEDYISGIKYDILLIDENMPFLLGSDIIKIITRLISSKQLNNIKIYSITGYSNMEQIKYIKECGAQGFYSKPLNAGMVEDLLRESGII